eukprot:COSAG05_NODE_13390_length_432_cov_0.933934_2_plen_67_part_01
MVDRYFTYISLSAHFASLTRLIGRSRHDDILQTQSMMCFMTAFHHWVRDTSIPKAVSEFPVPRHLFL